MSFPRAKLNYTVAQQIRADAADDLSRAEIAKKYKMSESHVTNVVLGRCWSTPPAIHDGLKREIDGQPMRISEKRTPSRGLVGGTIRDLTCNEQMILRALLEAAKTFSYKDLLASGMTPTAFLGALEVRTRKSTPAEVPAGFGPLVIDLVQGLFSQTVVLAPEGSTQAFAPKVKFVPKAGEIKVVAATTGTTTGKKGVDIKTVVETQVRQQAQLDSIAADVKRLVAAFS